MSEGTQSHPDHADAVKANEFSSQNSIGGGLRSGIDRVVRDVKSPIFATIGATDFVFQSLDKATSNLRGKSGGQESIVDTIRSQFDKARFQSEERLEALAEDSSSTDNSGESIQQLATEAIDSVFSLYRGLTRRGARVYQGLRTEREPRSADGDDAAKTNEEI